MVESSPGPSTVDSSWRKKKAVVDLLFTMTKALLTVLLIVLVTGDFIDEIDGLLRAGRDRIENLHRGLDQYQREADEIRGPSAYFRRDRVERHQK